MFDRISVSLAWKYHESTHTPLHPLSHSRNKSGKRKCPLKINALAITVYSKEEEVFRRRPTTIIVTTTASAFGFGIQLGWAFRQITTLHEQALSSPSPFRDAQKGFE